METVVYNWIPSDWTELYYSVQSMKRYLKNLDKIYILTAHDLPFEDEQVIRVFIGEEGDTKEKRVINNIRKFCEMNLCEDFIYMCDDFFVNKPFDNNDVLPVYIEDLSDVVGEPPITYWDRLLFSTYKVMRGMGFPTLNYAIHAPSYINCQCFLRMVRILGDHDYQWESGYFNIWAENPVHIDDLENYSICFDRPLKESLIRVTTRDIMFFSVTENGVTEAMKNFIMERFG